MRMILCKRKHKLHLAMSLLLLLFLISPQAFSQKKQPVKALYIPLADHYAALVAYERYRKKMKYADFKIQKMKNWDLLRGYFSSGEVDMAFVMSPLAIDMYNTHKNFRWIGLMHRDGNALAINDLVNNDAQLEKERKDRKPDQRVAKALKKAALGLGTSIEVGMPHLLSTHTVVLYRYLKENGLTLSLLPNTGSDVLAIPIAPPKAPAYIKGKNNRNTPAAFEQSLPWADVVETEGYGKVAWYSKDVMPWKNGHVECIAIATDKSIKNKFKAIKEVMFYIRKAGQDIEDARTKGGEKLNAIVKIVRKHIAAHTQKAIIASLSPKLRVINYQNLNIDELGLKQIMDLAVEGKILKKAINIQAFSDKRFDGK